jgi:hypothetical protein
LTVVSSPSITNQPSSQIVTEGRNATFSAAATGTAPLIYQWEFNGTNVSGATNSVYIINSVVTNNAGSYSVVVSNAYGVVTSSVVSLGVLLPPTGSLQVTITPTLAMTAGAQWQVDGGTLQNSGATVTNLSVGNHTVSFAAISGWTTPANQTVAVSANSIATASGTYVPQTGSLKVTISPPSAIAAGAKWQVDGGASQSANATVTNLSIGAHNVSFNSIFGWNTPAGQMVTITNGATTTVEGVYTLVDNAKPTLNITSPKVGQAVSNAAFTITGTAKDNVGVMSVYYQLNGGSWFTATSTNVWANWTAPVTLIPGTNSISAYAVDTSTNASATTNVSVFYVVKAPLAVQTNGNGTISPNYNEMSLNIGQNYSMKATAGPGFKFTDWTGSFTTNGSNLTFLMASNLTFTANFVDTNPPVLTVKSPISGQRWSNAAFTVTGSATDNVAVSNVFYSLNGGKWSNAVTDNNWTNWTAAVTLALGTNTNAVYAVDTSGNKSLTNTVKFLYIPSAILTVQTNGLGGINPVDNGKLLAIGTNYTLAAIPSNHWMFSNWVGGISTPYTVLTNGPTLTFAMQSNLVLQANFVTNPFLAVAGVYNGLFYPTNGVTEASSGFISATIASNSTGAYTAKVLLNGGSNSFSGSFDLTGWAQTALTNSGQTVSVSLSLDFKPADATMGGSVSNAAAGWNSVILADRAVFSANASPATNYAGHFTLLLPPDTNTAPTNSPDGYGYAAITNTLAGISTMGGALADGTPFLWSVPIARNGGAPLYQSLYSGKGSLLGWIYFTNEPPQNVSTNSSVSWIKPSVPNTLYPSGFTNLISNGVLGSPYKNTAGVPVLNLTNATLVLRNGNLKGAALIFTNLNSAKNTLTNLAGGTKLGETNYLVLAINTNNGVVTVTFQATGAKPNTVAHGAVLQNETNAAGYFLGTNQSGTFTLDPP